MKRFTWIAGIPLFALLLCFPGPAVNGAREAMAQWYYAVAPALLPFMALLPLLTCDAAASAYEVLLGGVMRWVFGLPGAAAPAVVVGLLAGSPAGTHALRRLAAGGALNRGQLRQAALACCGLSPGFLIAGVGASMLGSAALGRVLLRTQLAVQLLMLFLLRFTARDKARVELPGPEAAAGDGPMASAVAAVLSVGGWMALFGALSGIAKAVAGGVAAAALTCVLEVSSGARAVAGLALPLGEKLALLSATLGFGGLCVALQNLSAMKGFGVRRGAFLLARLAACLLSMGLTWAQVAMDWSALSFAGPTALRLSCLALCAALIPVLFQWKRTEA